MGEGVTKGIAIKEIQVLFIDIYIDGFKKPKIESTSRKTTKSKIVKTPKLTNKKSKSQRLFI
jgi:hypothetical protein